MARFIGKLVFIALLLFFSGVIWYLWFKHNSSIYGTNLFKLKTICDVSSQSSFLTAPLIVSSVLCIEIPSEKLPWVTAICISGPVIFDLTNDPGFLSLLTLLLELALSYVLLIICIKNFREITVD